MINDLRGIYTIWLRDVRRFLRDRPRIIGAAAQPALFLLLLGTGLGSNMSRGIEIAKDNQGVSSQVAYISFIYPGIIGMTLLFTSVFSAISIVWDREIGFLKEVMAAPIHRWTIAIGKGLGGSTVAMFQGSLMLIFAPLVGIKLTPLMILEIIPFLFFISFSLTSMGIVVAMQMNSMQGFTVVMNFIVLPMFFLSGAMFPLTNLPLWMDILVKINPLTYGVDILRRIVIEYGEYSISFDVAVVGIFGLVMIILAVLSFNKRD
ncbi:MAG: ABC transporter permease [Nitrospirota bacterium]